MEYAAFRCQICGDSKSTLHVHHSYYTRGKEPWSYPMGSMICVCEYHHEQIHGKHKTETPKIETSETSESKAGDEIAAAKFGAIFDMLE